MYYAFAVLAAILALALITLYVLREQTGFLQRRERVDRELHSDRTPTLGYEVPVGQDPTVVLAALERAGYTATTDNTHPRQTVLIACPGGIEGERRRVREVIESAGVTTPDDGAPAPVEVRFLDE
ncbi:MAG TPA: hypothetical protein VHO29_00960 [Marmoricola sp.]|nr:hypothetical protein [Marmoricola sp.]